MQVRLLLAAAGFIATARSTSSALLAIALVCLVGATPSDAVSLVTGDLLVVDLNGNSGETNDGLLRLTRPAPDGQVLWAGESFEEPSDLVIDAESGRLFFYGNGQGGKLWELDATTGLASEIVARGAFPGSPALLTGLADGPNGLLYLSGGDRLYTVDPDTGNVAVLLELMGSFATAMRPDGRVFLSAGSTRDSGNSTFAVGALYELIELGGQPFAQLRSVGRISEPAGGDFLGNYTQGIAIADDGTVLISTGFAGVGCGLECVRFVVRFDPDTVGLSLVFEDGGRWIASDGDDVLFTNGSRSVQRYDASLQSVATEFQSMQLDSTLGGMLILDRNLEFSVVPEPGAHTLAFAVVSTLACLSRTRASAHRS